VCETNTSVERARAPWLAVFHWISFADFYVWPHVQYFDSVDELFLMLVAATSHSLDAISHRMAQHNALTTASVVTFWRNAFTRGAAPSRAPRAQLRDHDASLFALYPDAAPLDDDCCASPPGCGCRFALLDGSRPECCTDTATTRCRNPLDQCARRPCRRRTHEPQ